MARYRSGEGGERAALEPLGEGERPAALRVAVVVCALLAFQILVTSLALVVASTILAAALCLIGIALAGWLFWKLVRVMGRIQAGEQRDRGHAP